MRYVYVRSAEVRVLPSPQGKALLMPLVELGR